MINLSLLALILVFLLRVRTEQHRFHRGLQKPDGEFEYNLKLSPLSSLCCYIITSSMSSQLQYQCRSAPITSTNAVVVDSFM